MPKRRLPFANHAGSTLVCLAVAAAGFVAAAFTTRFASLFFLLIADSACLLIASRAVRLRHVDGWRREFHDATVYLAMLAAYTALGSVLVAYPLHWLRNDASLGVALSISAAAVLALLALWRVWPAFGLAGMGVRYRRVPASRGRRLQERLAQAWRLTGDNEIFFGHGLLASLALFALTQGALVASGLGVPIASNARTAMLVTCVVLVLPLTWIVVQRAAVVLVTDLRRSRAERVPLVDAPALPTPENVSPPAEPVLADFGKRGGKRGEQRHSGR